MAAVRIAHVWIPCVACIIGAFTSDCNVTYKTTHPVVLGGNVTLTCALRCSHESSTFQQTWKKRTKGRESNVASYSEHGPHVDPEFSSYVSVFPTIAEEGFIKSSIEIRKLEKEDEACYKCYFNRREREAVYDEICLDDIGASNEVTCLAPAAFIGILMNPPEITTRNFEQDIKRSEDGNLLLLGRFVDTNKNLSCTFFKKKVKKDLSPQWLHKSNDEVVLSCSVAVYGTERLQIKWIISSNAGAKDTITTTTTTTTNGNITTIKSSLLLPRSLLTPDIRVWCIILPDAKGKTENLEEVNTFPKWAWFLLAVALILLVAAVYVIICRCCKRRKDKTSKDDTQSKNTEELPTQNENEFRDETPTKESGENNGLPNNGSSYTPRKLFN